LISGVFFMSGIIAAITAAICTGKEAHEDPSKRWIAGIAAGVFYIVVGIFGVTLAAVFMAFPATFITTLAGLALLGTIGGSLANAMADAKSREAALITFLAAAANIKLFGIGGAFWGLLIGLVAYALLNGSLPRRAPAATVAGDSALAPALDPAVAAAAGAPSGKGGAS